MGERGGGVASLIRLATEGGGRHTPSGLPCTHYSQAQFSTVTPRGDYWLLGFPWPSAPSLRRSGSHSSPTWPPSQDRAWHGRLIHMYRRRLENPATAASTARPPAGVGRNGKQIL